MCHREPLIAQEIDIQVLRVQMDMIRTIPELRKNNYSRVNRVTNFLLRQ